MFSAGIDLTELYQPKPERLEQFWTSFQNVILNLYKTPLAVVAAINVRRASVNYRTFTEILFMIFTGTCNKATGNSNLKKNISEFN